MCNDLMTIKQVAAALAVSVRTVARLVESGRLPSIKDGWFRRYKRADVEALKVAK